MEFHRVTASCRNIKVMAKQAVSGHWLPAAGIMLLATVLQSFLSRALLSFGNGDILSYLVYVLSVILLGALSSAVCAWQLAVFRMEEKPYRKLAAPFSGRMMFLKAAGLFALTSLLVVLGFFLFIIPGIIALYKYCLVFYVFFDHPEYTPGQCMAASAALMKGNKGQRFTLDMSFIGWYLLPLIPVLLSVVPLIGPMMRSAAEFVAAIPAEEFEALLTDDEAYAALTEDLSLQLQTVAADYIRTHEIFNILQYAVTVLRVLLSALVSVYAGLAGACFYELSCGKLTLRDTGDTAFSAAAGER